MKNLSLVRRTGLMILQAFNTSWRYGLVPSNLAGSWPQFVAHSLFKRMKIFAFLCSKQFCDCDGKAPCQASVIPCLSKYCPYSGSAMQAREPESFLPLDNILRGCPHFPTSYAPQLPDQRASWPVVVISDVFSQ
jgi:hypothetical protein